MNDCCRNQCLNYKDEKVYCRSCGKEYSQLQYYKSISGLTMDMIHAIFDDGPDYQLNWLLLSTSGIHGSYLTLDNLEADESLWQRGYANITAMVFQPRIVRAIYGEIIITRDDIDYLRSIVTKSIAGIVSSQCRNVHE